MVIRNRYMGLLPRGEHKATQDQDHFSLLSPEPMEFSVCSKLATSCQITYDRTKITSADLILIEFDESISDSEAIHVTKDIRRKVILPPLNEPALVVPDLEF